MQDRSSIDAKYKWNLQDIIESDEKWEEMFDELNEAIKTLDKYKGKLGDDDVLLQCYHESDELEFKLEKMYLYCRMHFDEDTSDSKYQSMFSKLNMLLVQISSVTSYQTPEICQRSVEQLKALSNSPAFSNYSYVLSELARNKERVLSDKEEAILSQVGLFSEDFQESFIMFNNADVKFKSIRDEEGKTAPISHGTYSKYMESPNRKVRKAAFCSMYDSFSAMNNTLATIYAGHLKRDWFFASTRKFSSCLEYAMDGENVPMEVYTNLLSAVKSGIPALTKYLKVRSKALNVPRLHCFDLYVPMVNECSMKYKYEEAYALVKEGLKPLGEEYQELLDKAFNEHWIDVYETANKRTGAYSWGTWGIPHPYVLLNYTETSHDVFTIAHELGHAMHTYYSGLAQPKAKSNYEIFVAEVASTVNETLLLKYLINKESGEMRKYLLSYFAEMFRTTVFRQTMFAEFEYEAHKLVEAGKPAVAEVFNDIYFKLNKKYYPKIALDDQIKYEWSRIPHFYRSFYVFKYATGLLSAVAIADGILSGDEKVINGYKEFLKAGNSMAPHEILKLTTVDLTKPATLKKSIKVFEDTIEELASYYD